MDRGTCCAVYVDNRVKLERWIRKESAHALETSPSEPGSCSLLGESAELRGNVELLLEVFKQGNVFLEIVYHSKTRCKGRTILLTPHVYLQCTCVIRGNRLPAN
jgi:hypothetical protein